ncbi:hypothetical protein [Enterovirga sp. CN4-39]|uniref:hypothetical protein n=1 Tax=Enterovirga sp. CN4-39 TaxID=3400910 RepID=UPI003C051917
MPSPVPAAADPTSPQAASPLAAPALPVVLALLGIAGLFFTSPVAAVIRELRLPDNDDLMRLAQVLDLVHGQDWFDKAQHRFGSPSAIVTHWSRLVDAPIALGILTIAPVLGERLASGLVALLWPSLLLAAFLSGLWAATGRWYGGRTAWLAVFAATQMTTMGLFAPGRIDHHNVQILAMLGVLFGLCDPAPDRRGAVWRGRLAGGLAALSLAVGLETLPFVAFCGAAAALAWLSGQRPHEAARFGAFGLALAITAPLLLAAETPPRQWLASHCDALSLPWILLACGGGLGATILARLDARLKSPRARLLAAGIAGAVTIVPFLQVQGGCIGSPLGDLPEIVRREWLDKVAEALSLPATLKFSPEMAFGGLLPIALAGGYALVQAWRATDPDAFHRDLILGGFLATGLAISVIQLRGIYISSAALPLVAGVALQRALAAAARRERPGRTIGALALALLMLGKVAALPLLAAGAVFERQSPVAVTRHLSNCAEEAGVRVLGEIAPGTVLAPVDLGTAILLFTPHRIVAAPYHRAASGIEASIRAFAGTEEDMKTAVAASGAGILALCRSWTKGAEGTFAHALASGAKAPWLDPIATGPGDLLAWRVAKRPQ